MSSIQLERFDWITMMYHINLANVTETCACSINNETQQQEKKNWSLILFQVCNRRNTGYLSKNKKKDKMPCHVAGNFSWLRLFINLFNDETRSNLNRGWYLKESIKSNNIHNINNPIWRVSLILSDTSITPTRTNALLIRKISMFLVYFYQ